MKKKNKKFESMRSILQMIQQIQVQDFGQHTFWLQTYNTFFNVSIWSKDNLKLNSFEFYSHHSPKTLEKTYNELLNFIKDN